MFGGGGYQNPLGPLPSMRSQCPVSTQMHTIINERKKDKISAAVNRPHTPNDILQPEKQYRISLKNSVVARGELMRSMLNENLK